LAEQYTQVFAERFSALGNNAREFTELFIEARYSLHEIKPDKQESALEHYRVLLEELRTSGSGWQKTILGAGFLFRI